MKLFYLQQKFRSNRKMQGLIYFVAAYFPAVPVVENT